MLHGATMMRLKVFLKQARYQRGRLRERAADGRDTGEEVCRCVEAV
jgi:hypothetical protein